MLQHRSCDSHLIPQAAVVVLDGGTDRKRFTGESDAAPVIFASYPYGLVAFDSVIHFLVASRAADVPVSVEGLRGQRFVRACGRLGHNSQEAFVAGEAGIFSRYTLDVPYTRAPLSPACIRTSGITVLIDCGLLQPGCGWRLLERCGLGSAERQRRSSYGTVQHLPEFVRRALNVSPASQRGVDHEPPHCASADAKIKEYVHSALRAKQGRNNHEVRLKIGYKFRRFRYF